MLLVQISTSVQAAPALPLNLGCVAAQIDLMQAGWWQPRRYLQTYSDFWIGRVPFLWSRRFDKRAFETFARSFKRIIDAGQEVPESRLVAPEAKLALFETLAQKEGITWIGELARSQGRLPKSIRVGLQKLHLGVLLTRGELLDILVDAYAYSHSGRIARWTEVVVPPGQRALIRRRIELQIVHDRISDFLARIGKIEAAPIDLASAEADGGVRLQGLNASVHRTVSAVVIYGFFEKMGMNYLHAPVDLPTLELTLLKRLPRGTIDRFARELANGKTWAEIEPELMEVGIKAFGKTPRLQQLMGMTRGLYVTAMRSILGYTILHMLVPLGLIALKQSQASPQKQKEVEKEQMASPEGRKEIRQQDLDSWIEWFARLHKRQPTQEEIDQHVKEMLAVPDEKICAYCRDPGDSDDANSDSEEESTDSEVTPAPTRTVRLPRKSQ